MTININPSLAKIIRHDEPKFPASVFDGMAESAHLVIASGMTTPQACRHFAIMIEALREEDVDENLTLQEFFDL